MIFELHRIRNSLMIKESQQRTQSSITTTFTIIMIKFLSNNIKFLMYASLKSFILKTLFLKVSHRLSILQRSIHDISCDILIDSNVYITDSTISSLTTNRISRNTSIIYLSTVRVRDEYRSCRRQLSVETALRDRSSLHHESIYKIASNKCRKT